MANSKGTADFKNSMCAGKQLLLPPKSPFQSTSLSNSDYGSSSTGSKGILKPREGHRPRQRTSSESFLFEEQPPWLDELLNEPETPARRGAHRRSSSDSFAYLEASNNSYNRDSTSWEEYKHGNIASVPSWGSLDFDHFRDALHASSYTESCFKGQRNMAWESPLNSVAYPGSLSPVRDNIIGQGSGSSCAPSEPDGVASVVTEKQDQDESHLHDLQGSSERGDHFSARPSASEVDPKRAKQQFAQRSRVRKLQYIAELERSVQTMQVEGCEISAELEFLGQQHIILSMENKALKQRLDSLAQEQLIKYFEQELLEGEIARLRALVYQQQLPQLPPSTRHRRNGSRESGGLDSQLANLSLRHKEANSGRDPVSGSLRI
ncbi:uncharacterized protein At4g06598-like [Magnolia sinica]|uniref:uncharacterized protein At4g06598-like n=1 Tax=Magnolia sinica TaxID=86752 RepID=UPI00265801CF|nr:uncharacterized protein At4g06598-like [Magnolia sinica]XP_058097413.1 uncharacterized protein At4g06598-like [Magnolia sinica]